MGEAGLWVQRSETRVARAGHGAPSDGSKGKHMRCERLRCGGRSQVGVRSHDVVWFGTDQSDILRYIHTAIG